jgi:hypothetical protein
MSEDGVKGKLTEELQKKRTELRMQLAQRGVARVEATYSGSGDSGYINDPRLLGKEDVELLQPDRLSQDVDNFFYDLLEDRHGGWEINDGADGVFFWDIVEDTILWTHNDNFLQQETTEYSL